MLIQLILAFRYLWGRKLRAVLTTLAVVFGVLVIFGMNILLPTMLRAFEANLLAASGQVDVTITHNTGESFSINVLNKVKAADGVRAAAGSLSRTVNLPAGWFGRNAPINAVSLVGLDPRAAQLIRNYPVKQGRFLRMGDDESAVITTSLADQLGLALGDELNLPTTQGTVPLTIVGILPARTLPGNEEVLVTLYQAQKLFDLSRRINTIEANLNTTDPARRDAIEKNIEALLGNEYRLGALASGTELFASLQLGQAAFNMFGVLALFMGGFIIFNTFRTIVAERRRDIGMLRAVGASRRTIIGVILAEGFLQGGVGTLIGMGLGYLMAAGLMLLMAPIMQEFIHLQIGAPVVTPGLIIVTVILGVGVTLFAGLLPAVSASRVAPLEALRPSLAEASQPAIGKGTITGVVLIGLAILALMLGNVGLVVLGGLLFLAGLVLIAPALVKPIANVFGMLAAAAFARDGTGTLARGNLTRQPSRAAVTASVTMIGLAMLVAVGGQTASLTNGFLNVLRKSLGSDYLLVPPAMSIWQGDVGASNDLADKIRAVNGVGLVSTMRYAAATVNGAAISLLGIDPEVFPQVAGLNFQEGSDKIAYAQLAAGRGLIVNGPFAANTGLKVGDTVKLATPEGVRDYVVVGVAGDYLNAKIMAGYVSQESLRADFHKAEDIFIQVNLAPGADADAVEKKLKAIIADYPQFSLVSGRAFFEENKRLMDAAFMGMYVLFMVLALPSLIAMLNTLAIGVIERTREIGMLRAIGSTQKQVRRMVLTEAFLLATIGTAFGLLAGLYLGYLMVAAIHAAGFPVTYSFPLSGVLGATAVGLVFGAIAALIPARQAAKLDIVTALHYE